LSQGKHILLIEAKDEGHHLVYVNALVEAMKSQGNRVTVSLPERGGTTREKLSSRHCPWLDQIDWIPWTAGLGPSMLPAAAKMKSRCGADEVFFACVDEWASGTLRRAAFGLTPPKALRACISGIYVRPRPIDPDCRPRSLNAWLKRKGWRYLDQRGWFRRVFVLDERLPAHRERHPGKCRVEFMPEPHEMVVAPYPSQNEARQRLGVPPEAVVFLHYGLGTRRKGLHHVLGAWQKLPADCPALLLAAGQLEPEFLEPLEKLQSAGRVHLLNRYIGSEEEQVVMAASDIVLMPYVDHYGSSNVLSKAAAANRMVLASDQGLVGYRVRQYQLGETCVHDDAESLHQAVIRLAASDFAATGQWYTDHLRAFAAWGSPDKLSRLFAKGRE